MNIPLSYNIDISRELTRNPFCKVARVSNGDGVNFRTVTTTIYPPFFTTDENEARKIADEHGVECVRIVFASEWNGEISFKFMGYGFLSDDVLLDAMVVF